MDGQVAYPYVVTGSDGKMVVQDRALIQIGGVIPLGMPITDINECVSQAMNLFVSTLIKDCFKAGYSAT
jgi:nickel-dependent lactate racemase